MNFFDNSFRNWQSFQFPSQFRFGIHEIQKKKNLWKVSKTVTDGINERDYQKKSEEHTDGTVEGIPYE